MIEKMVTSKLLKCLFLLLNPEEKLITEHVNVSQFLYQLLFPCDILYNNLADRGIVIKIMRAKISEGSNDYMLKMKKSIVLLFSHFFLTMNGAFIANTCKFSHVLMSISSWPFKQSGLIQYTIECNYI